MNELRTRIIEKAIENRVDVAATKEYLKHMQNHIPMNFMMTLWLMVSGNMMMIMIGNNYGSN